MYFKALNLQTNVSAGGSFQVINEYLWIDLTQSLKCQLLACFILFLMIALSHSQGIRINMEEDTCHRL